MRFRGALYSSCTIPKIHMAVPHNNVRTMTQTTFCACIIQIFEAPWQTEVHNLIRLCIQIIGFRRKSYRSCMIPKIRMAAQHCTGCTVTQTALFLTLYGYVQLPDEHGLTGTTCCVQPLWGPVVPHTVNVQILKLALQNTIPRVSLWY